MQILLFLKNNVVKLIIQVLIISTLIISIISIDFTIEIMHEDGKSVNYAGIIRGGTQRLIKQELQGIQNDDLIAKLDEVIFQLKNKKDKNNHFAIHEDAKLQELLLKVESTWIILKDEIYNHRLNNSSKMLFDLSEVYYDLANDLVFDTQVYVESKVEKLASMRSRLFISIILILIFSIYQFISKLLIQKENIELNNVVYIDSLTGLSNRAHCNEIIQKYNEMKALPDLVCVYIDLNNLKITNDLFGHEAGDKLIKDFSIILKEVSDPYGFVCRNGGDEFVAIFENCTEKNINDYISFLNEKTNAYNLKEQVIHISFAIGVAFTNEISSNKINDLLTLSDKRMYENKAEYKKRQSILAFMN